MLCLYKYIFWQLDEPLPSNWMILCVYFLFLLLLLLLPCAVISLLLLFFSFAAAAAADLFTMQSSTRQNQFQLNIKKN